jgi:hypothetical protein
LRPPAVEVPVRIEGDTTFVSGRPEWAPPFEHIELDSPAEVDKLEGPPDGFDLVVVWAWKDEATGDHAVRLAAWLGRRVMIWQGKGSLIFAEPRPDGTVEIWGHTELVEVRKYTSLPNP